MEELGGMKRAGKDLEEGFAPGFVCYGIPVGSKEYVSHMLKEKAEEVASEVEEISDILGQDSQAMCMLKVPVDTMDTMVPQLGNWVSQVRRRGSLQSSSRR